MDRNKNEKRSRTLEVGEEGTLIQMSPFNNCDKYCKERERETRENGMRCGGRGERKLTEGRRGRAANHSINLNEEPKTGCVSMRGGGRDALYRGEKGRS